MSHESWNRLPPTGVSWALLVYMQNCQPTLLVLIDRKVKLVDLFKTMELLNNSYAFYMLGRGREPPLLSVNAFCIVTNSAHETPVYPFLYIGKNSPFRKKSVHGCY